MKKVLILLLLCSLLFFALALIATQSTLLIAISGVLLGFNLALCLSVFVGAAIQQKHLVRLNKLEKDLEEEISN